MFFLDPVLIEERSEITEEPAEIEYTVLQKGSKGDEVAALQQRLIDLSYLYDSEADGDYGKKTVAAITKFQNALGLDVTGIADEETQRLLFSEDTPEAQLEISKASYVMGSTTTTSWLVDGHEFTLSNGGTKTIETAWGTYIFNGYGEYEEAE